MRHLSTFLLSMLATGLAWGQTPAEASPEPTAVSSPEPTAVKQALQEALTLQVPAPAALAHLPENPSEPPRVVAPPPKPAKAPSPRLSGEVLERAGKMAPRMPANPRAERPRPDAAAAHASKDSQAAAGQVQADKVRGQRPPREGTPGAPPSGHRPLPLSPGGPATPVPPSSPSGPTRP